MTTQPWQQLKASPNVIAILDVAHGIEQAELERFLHSELHQNAIEATIHECVVPIVRDSQEPPAANLLPLLELPDETLVLPLRVVWRTSLEKTSTRPRARDLLFGNPRRPNASRARRILQQNPERVVCIAGEPATLETLRRRRQQQQASSDDPSGLATFIALQAGLALDVAERRLRGSRYKVPRGVATSLLASSKFREALKTVSAETGRDMADLLGESAEIMDELVSRPQPFWLDVMAQLNDWVINLGYDAEIVVDQEGLERVRQFSRENPTALLWTHKTHVDGFAVNSVCFNNDFPAPHILGGVNMAFAGMGFLARRAGAIFIRRSFQNDPLYKTVLRQYIGYLMDKRFPLSWSFEGTRSRVGKLMPPRYGLLKYVMDSAHDTGAENLHVIPISISYDMIGDVKDYASEQAGGIKRPESLSWFIGYLRGLRQPMGSIYFNFGEPVVLPTVPSPEDPRELQKVAFAVGVEANRVTPITLPSVVCMSLLGASPRALTQDELTSQVRGLVDWARDRGVPLTEALDQQNVGEVAELVEKMISTGLITRYDDGPEAVFALAAEQHGEANYYRNTVIHFYLNKAIGELALLGCYVSGATGEDAFWERAEELRDLFKFEFFYAPKDEFRRDISAELTRYDQEWIESISDREKLLALWTRFVPFTAHIVLLPFVESYRVVADILARQPIGEDFTAKDCEQQCLAYGRQAYLQRRISSEASIGKLLFANGYQLMDNLDLIEGDGEDLQERRLQMAQRFRDLQRQLERVRAAALP